VKYLDMLNTIKISFIEHVDFAYVVAFIVRKNFTSC
jgi:hypothetical protein